MGHTQRADIRMTSDLLSTTMKAKIRYSNAFKYLNEMISEPEFYTQGFTCEHKIKTLPDLQVLKNLPTMHKEATTG